MFVDKFKVFVDWFLKMYWAALFVWFVALLKVITGRKVGLITDIQDWVIIVGGSIFIMGFLSSWAGGRHVPKE